MSINAYVGLMGSGKSYECVSVPILRAIRAGRRVVTNIDGIDSDQVRAFLVREEKLAIKGLGEVVHCQNDQILLPDFLPCGREAVTFCQPGDLVCIDEAWRFWGNERKLLEEHRIFFAEHRHYVHQETKVACDLVLMVQDIMMINRGLRVLVEVTFNAHKIKSLGLSKIYRIEIYEGYKLNRRTRINVENKKYDKRIFALYSSYVGGTGTEYQVDARQNILRQPKFLLVALGVMVLLIWSISHLVGFFSKKSLVKEKKEPDTSVVSRPIYPVASTEKDLAVWRLVGAYSSEKESYGIFRSKTGETKIIAGASPSMFQGLRSTGFFKGKMVTTLTIHEKPTGNQVGGVMP